MWHSDYKASHLSARKLNDMLNIYGLNISFGIHKYLCYLPFQNLWPFRNGQGRFDTFARFRKGLAVLKRPTFPLGRFDTSPV